MERVDIHDVDPDADPATVKRPLTDALGASNLAINYYELAPGDSFAYGYHMHEAQEELFVVQSGTVTFETEDGTVTVESGEAIRFGPGEYQQGINRGSDRVEAIAVGAPQELGDSELLRECETCGDRTPHAIEVADGGDVKRTRCTECGETTGRFTR